MRLLRRLLTFICIGFCGQVFLAVLFRHERPDFFESLVRQSYRVSTHISDKTNGSLFPQCNSLIQPLCKHHGLFGRKIQFSGCFLLKSTGDKRSARISLSFFFDNIFQNGAGPLQTLENFVCLVFIGNLSFIAVNFKQFGLKLRFLTALQLQRNRPVLPRLEG